MTHITINEQEGLSAVDVAFNLSKGNPSIVVRYLGSNKIGINPMNLREDEEKLLVSALKEMLEKQS